MNIAINGFGRIGRQIFRQAYERGFGISLINDPFLSLDQARILSAYDSIYEKFCHNVTSEDSNKLIIDNQNKIKYYSTKKISELSLSNVDILIDSSGKERRKLEYKEILKEYPNLKKIIITTFSKIADQIIIDGVNQDILKKDSKIISTCTCDSVAILPIIKKCIKKKIDSVSIITLHPFLSNQKLLDGCDIKLDDISLISNWRAAPDALIPKKTSIENIAIDIFPKLKGKLNAYQIRVPTTCVSCAFIDINFEEIISKEWINNLLESLKGYYLINSDYLTSRDFMNDKHSGVIDLRRFIATEKGIKFLVWYDNESGYCSKVLDLVILIDKNEGL